MIIDLKSEDKHIVIKEAKTYEQIYINICAFLATDTDQISFEIHKDSLNEFNHLLTSLKDATIFRFINLKHEQQDTKMMYVGDFNLFLKAFDSIRNSDKMFVTHYYNDEDKDSIAVMTIVKGDSYGTH